MFGCELEKSRLSVVWMLFQCWYHKTRIFKGATCYCVRRWYWYPILASSSLPQHTLFERYLSHINDWKSNPQQRECYSVREVINHLLKRGEPTLPYLLFVHAFTGCDTTSAIYQFGKTSIFKKLKNSKRLRNIADILYKNGQNPLTTGTAAISSFEA